jgi:hypothetical protein
VLSAKVLSATLRDLKHEQAQTRVRAANRLIDATPTPIAACEDLVRALEDPGTWDEEWIDYGAVVGGTLHVVAERAAAALAGVGLPGLWCLLEAAAGGAEGARAHVARVVSGLSADALAEASASDRQQARALIEASSNTKLRGPALKDLDWADERAATAGDRWSALEEQLRHPSLADRRKAVEGLRDHPRPAYAAALLADVLLLGDRNYGDERTAAATLLELGPLLDDERLARLVAGAVRNRPFQGLPALFSALSCYGERARALAPTLVTWLAADPPRRVGAEHHNKLRKAAVAGLRELGDAASDAHDALLEGWWNTDGDARRPFSQALGPEVLRDRCLPRLIRDLGKSGAARGALGRLEELGPYAAPALKHAIGLLAQAPQQASAVLANLGEDAAPAVPKLVEALGAPQGWWAAIALGKLGAVAAEAEPALSELASRAPVERTLDRFVAQALRQIREACRGIDLND